jgi:hypothetical protein
MKFAKINREGYPANTVCPVVEYGKHESVVKLPDGKTVRLYTAFLYEDRETRAKERSAAQDFLDRHPARKR